MRFQQGEINGRRNEIYVEESNWAEEVEITRTELHWETQGKKRK
jgi:hypothetical protein